MEALTAPQIGIKTVNFDGYKIEFSDDTKNRPIGRLFKLLSNGKNKGKYKQLNGFYFANKERREEWAKEQMERIKGRIKDANKEREEKKEATGKHTFKVGDILYQSWGYDQTNIDFFQVVSILPKSVVIRGIGQKVVNGSEGFMCENVMPDKDNFIGEERTRPVKVWLREGTQPTYSVSNGRHSLRLYNGGEKGIYQSHYA